MNQRSLLWVFWVLAPVLAGCAPKNVRVRCDGHLSPINPAAITSDAKPASRGDAGTPNGGAP